MRWIARCLGSPQFLFWLNLVAFIFLLPWTALLAIPSSPLFRLGQEVAYVTLISHIALILGALSTLQSARVEIKQREAEQRRVERDNELAEKIEQQS